jgi:DNA-directed RNA polymerase specialized sigma24 family protein
MGGTGRVGRAPGQPDRVASRTRSHRDQRCAHTGAFADSAVCQALENLYYAHYVSLVRLAALLTGDAIMAEDVAVDALAALAAGPSGAGLPGPALPWLHRQVVVRSRRALRLRLPGPGPDCGSGLRIASPGWRSAPVIGLLTSLSASQREAVVLRHYVELSDEETAAAMGASLRAVRRSLEQARQALAAALPGESPSRSAPESSDGTERRADRDDDGPARGDRDEGTGEPGPEELPPGPCQGQEPERDHRQCEQHRGPVLGKEKRQGMQDAAEHRAGAGDGAAQERVATPGEITGIGEAFGERHADAGSDRCRQPGQERVVRLVRGERDSEDRSER